MHSAFAGGLAQARAHYTKCFKQIGHVNVRRTDDVSKKLVVQVARIACLSESFISAMVDDILLK